MRSFALRSALFFACSASALLASERPAHACGGCFNLVSAGTESTVVTDHRMAFSVSTKQTILWDQIEYQGDPKEFAWVLPVKQGAVVELSHDEWFAALDAVTKPTITGPVRNCGGGGGGIGCGGGGTSAPLASEDNSSGGAGGTPPVQVVNQSVVGPYETVTLRSTDAHALENWLDSHGYGIPDAFRPTVAAYVSEGFDFIALRLLPGKGVKAMQPVRVVTQGADATLPLRMVAAGVGAQVGITLYVIGEGRYEAQNFPNATIDDSQLVWFHVEARSNYQDLAEQTMQQANGHTWLTEAARPQTLVGDPSQVYCYSYGPNGASYGGTLADVYFAQCACGTRSQGLFTDAALDAPLVDSGGDSGDGASDAQADAPTDASADSGEAGGDAGADGGSDGGSGGACAGFDDLDAALVGMHARDVWITRMRALLPVDALAEGDLHLQASSPQAQVSNYHSTDRFDDPTYSPCGTNGGCTASPNEPDAYERGLVLGAFAFAGVALFRRRRRG